MVHFKLGSEMRKDKMIVVVVAATVVAVVASKFTHFHFMHMYTALAKFLKGRAQRK